jgi:F420-non-reducing hydrogenase small subunit
MSTLFSMEILQEMLNKFTIVYFPFLLDETEIGNVDDAMIEGCITETAQIETLKQIREKANRVIALGTCACYGGIPSLSHSVNAQPITRAIEVDGMLPGCPPPPELLNEACMKLIEGKRIAIPDRNACASCPRRGEAAITAPVTIKRFVPDEQEAIPQAAEDASASERCFLKGGVFCAGPITRDGCDARCIKHDVPCEGCMGAISGDFTAAAVNFLSGVSIDPALAGYEGLFWRFSRPLFQRGGKP